jgi:uncharacterized small protein (DUF1192 family)
MSFLQLDDQGKLGEVNHEITEMQAEIERALESNRLKKPKDMGRHANYLFLDL